MLATAEDSNARNCTLASLQVWAGASPLRLEPHFSEDVRNYKAAVDFDAEPIWVDPVASGNGCKARRSDQGQAIPAGGSGKVSVSLSGQTPHEISVALRRRSGNDGTLEALSLTGAEISPTFDAATRKYHARLGSDGGSQSNEVVIAVRPVDMGQGLQVMLRSAEGHDGEKAVPETQASLKQLRYRWRNFSLGTSADLDQLSTSHPLEATVRIWPASAVEAGHATGTGPPVVQYRISIQPVAHLGENHSNSHTTRSNTGVSYTKHVVAASLALLLCCICANVVRVTSGSVVANDAGTPGG